MTESIHCPQCCCPCPPEAAEQREWTDRRCDFCERWTGLTRPLCCGHRLCLQCFDLCVRAELEQLSAVDVADSEEADAHTVRLRSMAGDELRMHLGEERTTGLEVKTIVAYNFAKRGQNLCSPAQVRLLYGGREVTDSEHVECGVVLDVIIAAMAWVPRVRSWVVGDTPRAEELEQSILRLSERALPNGVGSWGSAPGFNELVRSIDDLLQMFVEWGSSSLEHNVGAVIASLLKIEQSPDATPTTADDAMGDLFLD